MLARRREPLCIRQFRHDRPARERPAEIVMCDLTRLFLPLRVRRSGDDAQEPDHDLRMAEHGAVKLIPPAKVMAAELERQLAAAVRSSVIDRILREAKAEQQISKALRKIKRPSGPAFIKGIKAMFAADDKQPWRDFIRDAVRRLASGVRT
jgi:hypothetical protein